jgi:hypothetical protein
MKSSHPKGRNGARNERSGGPALARVDGDDARRRLTVRIGAARVFGAEGETFVAVEPPTMKSHRHIGTDARRVEYMDLD